MARPITITIRGTETEGVDAPTVEDLLSQIQDFVAILHGVEEAVSQSSREEIVWRVTDVSKNSPLRFEVTPYPKVHAMNIDQLAEQVVGATANGFQRIAETGERPMFFTDPVVRKAERVFCRVDDGLADTVVDFTSYGDVPQFSATKASARQFVERLRQIGKPAPVPHKEIGSLEGYVAKVELDGHGRPIVWLRSRLDGQVVKCFSTNDGLNRIGHFEVAEVLRGLRVRVHGILRYRDTENLNSIDVDFIHVFEPDNELPEPEDIIDPNLTGGVEASEFLEALRADG